MPPTRIAPGPDAERAFVIGLAASTLGALCMVGLLFRFGVLTPVGAFVALLAGVPVHLVVSSCVLGVWLGFADDSYLRVLASASRR